MRKLIQFCMVFTMTACSVVPALIAGWLICPWFWPTSAHAAWLFNDNGAIIGSDPAKHPEPPKDGREHYESPMVKCDAMPTWIGALACRFDNH